MRIHFTQPKYVLPLIATPFIFLLFHLNKDLFAEKVQDQEVLALEQREEINPDMSRANLDKRDIKSKFDSFKDRFKRRDDYTAMLGLEEEVAEEKKAESLYSEEEKRIIDSVNAAIMDGKQQDFMTNVNERNNSKVNNADRHPKRQTTSRRITESDYDREMRMFREQMKVMDSLTKTPEQQQAETLDSLQQQQARLEADRIQALVDVQKAGSNRMTDQFNTIVADVRKQFIRAILDEGLKFFEGSRVRIRLMDDIEAGDYLVEKGTYLFGTVQSFSQQRVHIQVSSMQVDGKILPVVLTLYDNDGLPGLYVPGSKFRDFTKELVGNVSSGNNIQLGGQDPQNQSQFFYGIAQRALQSTTRAAGKATRRNKAFLKYNTIVYLVGPDDLKEPKNER